MNTLNNKEEEAQILIRTIGSNCNSGTSNVTDNTRANMMKVLERAHENNILI